mmetsp:Transcript_354/g.566  ORF Transcript_354/g.566 Transcript_354/m.566 type:complete len:109 (+) Transcript_354:125-451(+)
MRGPKPFVNVYKSSAYADVESAATPGRPAGQAGREGPDVYDEKFAETLRGLLSGVGLNENREIQKAQFDTVTHWVDQYKPKGGSNSVIRLTIGSFFFFFGCQKLRVAN